MIVINKKTNQLGFYQSGLLKKVFPVATGRQRSYTPEGSFRVINKLVNPPYYKKKIPGGSPYNPLGTRWLGLSAPGGPYGIHGNSNAASIGTYASAGCIRLRNEDILWLYDQVQVGTPVIIVWNDINLNSGFIDNKPVKLYFNNEAVTLENHNKTFSQQNKPYIPLKVLCNLLDYQINWNNETNTIELRTLEQLIQLTPNSKTALVNSQYIILTDPPLVMDGVTYVTQSTIEAIFPVYTNWKTTGRELHLQNKTNNINTFTDSSWLLGNGE